MSALQVFGVIFFVIGVASAVWMVRLQWVDRRRGETTWGAGGSPAALAATAGTAVAAAEAVAAGEIDTGSQVSPRLDKRY